MSGLAALLVDLGGLLIGVTILATAARRSKRRARGLPLLILLLAVPIVLFHGWGIGYKGVNLFWLWTLEPGDVASIEVGSKSLADSEALSIVVVSLNDATWLVAEHSCQRSEVPFTIRTTSGSERHWGVARNPCRGGTVINLSPIMRVGLYHGGVFSEGLEQALESQGIRLPTE